MIWFFHQSEELKDSYDVSSSEIGNIVELICSAVQGSRDNFFAKNGGRENVVDVIITTGFGYVIPNSKHIQEKVTTALSAFGMENPVRVVFVGGTKSIAEVDSESRINLATAIQDIENLQPGFYIQSEGRYIDVKNASRVFSTSPEGIVSSRIGFIPPIEFGEKDRGVANDIYQYAGRYGFEVDLVGPKLITAFSEDACLEAAGHRPDQFDFASLEVKQRAKGIGWADRFSAESKYKSEVRTTTWMAPIKIKGNQFRPAIIVQHTFADERLNKPETVRDKILIPSFAEGTEIIYQEKSGGFVSSHCDLARGEYSWVSIEARAGNTPVIHIVSPKLAAAIYATTNAGQEGSMVFNPSVVFARLNEVSAAKNDGMSRVIVSDKLCKAKQVGPAL